MRRPKSLPMHDHHDFGPEITIDGFSRDIAERHSTIGKVIAT